MSLREFLTHNFWLKCFSLILATLVWFTVRFQINQGQGVVEAVGRQTFRGLRITVLSDAADTRVFQVTPSQVSVTATADAGVRSHLAGKDFQVFVNLIDPEAARTMIRKVEVLCPPGVTQYTVEPPVVRVDLVKETALEAPTHQP